MKKFTHSLIGLGLLASAPQLLADVGGSATLTTDYQFRGITQSAENPAAQVSLDYFNDTGFYAGIFGSNVDFYAPGDPADNGESIEIDYYLGYANSVNDIDYDVGLIYYTYPGAEASISYAELLLSATYKSFTASYGYSNDLYASDEAGHYLSGAYELALPNDFALTLQAGYSFGDAFDSNIDESPTFLDEYVDYSVTLGKSFSGFDVSLSYVDTDMSGDFVIKKDQLANDGRFILSVAKAF